MLLFQGIARLPKSNIHWDESELFSTVGAFYITKIKFQLIRKFICFHGQQEAG